MWAAGTSGSDAGLEERERRKDLLRTREPEQTFGFLSLREVVIGHEDELYSGLICGRSKLNRIKEKEKKKMMLPLLSYHFCICLTDCPFQQRNHTHKKKIYIYILH